MSEQERKEIISCISGILTSTTRRMTIRQLLSDYENLIGEKIPFRRFGYDSIGDFLRTMRDRVQVIGSGLNAEVQIVISEKTAHINELVSKQKVSINKNSRKSFNSRPPNRRSFNLYSQTSTYSPRSSSFGNNQRSLPHGANRHSSHSASTSQSSVVKDVSFKESAPIQKQTCDNNANLENTGTLPKQSPKHYTADMTSGASDIFFSDEEYECEVNTKVPQIIQCNLKKLISKYPDGIWASQLLDSYKKEYGKLLTYSGYGYRSVAQMCADLRNIFNIIQSDTSDVKLFGKSQPIPQDTLNYIMKLQLMKMKANSDRPAEPALPESHVELMSDIYREKLPPDVVPFGTKLQQQWLDPGTNEDDFVDVNIGEVYDPSKFWLNLSQYGCALNTLMDNMQTYYNEHKDELAVPYLALKKDLYIAGIYMNEYHRARIVDITQRTKNLVKVYFVDYGTVALINISTVCYLHNQFSDLPEQAIRGRLSGIYPPTENEQWSRTASSRFLSMVAQKNLVANLMKIDEERKILDVILADTSDPEEDFFINDALVHLGFAIFTSQVNLESVTRDLDTTAISDNSSFCSHPSTSSYTPSSCSISNESSKADGSEKRNKKTSLTPKEVMSLLKRKS